MREWYYWYVARRTQRIIPWIARKLPKKLKYYVVIHGAVSVEPQYNPADVTALQMLELWES